MAGYNRDRATTIFTLKFDDPIYEGLIIKAKSTSLGDIYRITELADLAGKEVRPEDLSKVNGLIEMFAKCLVSWNLTEDDNETPIPATIEGLNTLDIPFVMAVIMSWMQATAGVSGPLVKPSQDGGTSPMGLIPMETL